MRRRLWATALAGLWSGAALVTQPGADAAYLDYYGRFGDWTVICAGYDRTAGDEEDAALMDCAIEGVPPPSGARATSLVAVYGGRGEGATVSVRRIGAAHPSSPVYLRVDDRAAHRVEPTLAGEVLWRGAEAQAIVEELQAGTTLVVRSFTGAEWTPFDEVIALQGFADALAAFGDRRRASDPSPASHSDAPSPSPERDAHP